MPGKVLCVNVLGGFSLAYDDQAVVSINTARLQSLLAYLVLHANSPQPRQHVAFLLWPDTSESNARNNLRQFVHLLRRALPDPDRFLSVTAQTLCWQTAADQIVDVQRFEQAVARAAEAEQHADWNSAQQWLKEALATYQGDLLPGCYDEWITPERDRLRQQCLAAHQRLAYLLEQQRDYAAALQVAQAWLRLDPLDESACLALMRLHDLNHDRPAAQRVYLTAVETLHRELAVEPGEALRQAYERMQRAPETRYPDQAASSLKLVGRHGEWQQLQAAWQRATDGDAQLVLITGEAGIGKSRLAEELYRWAEQQSFTIAQTRSYAAEGRLSFAPVADWLRSAALRPQVNTLAKVWLTEIARLLPELLSEHADLTRPEPISEYGQRQRFFEALARAILAAPQPMLLWIDDLQWCDSETLEWLHFLLRYKPRHPLLVLGTARSEESPPDHPLSSLARQLRAESKLTSIELSPLDAAETARLASQTTGHELSIAASIRLFRETEGNPLFVIETMRASPGSIFVAGSSETTETEPQSHVLPPRVYAVIAGRLAQLSPIARKVAELGAAIGRAFTFDIVQQAGQDDEDSIAQALDELWQKRIVREQSPNVFDFTHDKLREVAYAEISTPQRRLLHRRVAQVLELIQADDLHPVSAQIAAQYDQAGLIEQALPHYHRAGIVAAGVYANDEAIGLLTRELALLSQLPSGVKRDTQELAILLALAPLYRITKGWAAQDTERVANRAQVLSTSIGSVAQQVQALWLQQTVDVVAARFDKVLQSNAEMQRLLKEPDAIPLPFIEVHFAGTRFFMGQFATANELFEQMLAGRAEDYIPDFRLSHGVNYWAHSLVWNSHAIWCLGYPEKALKTCEEGIRVAQEFIQPFNHALAITYLATLQEWCSDAVTFQATVQAAEALSREFDVRYYLSWATILLCFAQTVTQPSDGNLAHLREAIRAFKDTGARIRLPYYWSLLARAYHRAGRLAEAFAALEEAFDDSRQREEYWWDAELYRLRGELRWTQAATADEVEAAFFRSIEIAQSQLAKSLELRAATSLARLWQATGRSAVAKELLVPLYNWFTEGFDTPDLQAARSLIALL